ncbi:MAG TPA: YMGG-like glycine zipper-containing protein [Thalassobaculum sp.]
MFGRLMSIRAVALATALSVSVSACQTTGMGSSTAEVPLTPAEQQLRDDADQFNETMLGGAATGAVIGAVLGALLGAASGKGEDIARGALIGAAAGGVLGGVDGYVTAKAQENSNNQVRMLNSMAEDVRTDNQRLERIVANSDQVLADSKEQLERIRNDVAAKKVSVAEATAQRQRVEENRQLLQTTLETAAEKRDKYRQAAAELRAQGGDTGEMDREIALLEQQVKDLETNVSSLNSALEVTRVG